MCASTTPSVDGIIEAAIAEHRECIKALEQSKRDGNVWLRLKTSNEKAARLTARVVQPLETAWQKPT